jgi:hypothetical protein
VPFSSDSSPVHVLSYGSRERVSRRGEREKRPGQERRMGYLERPEMKN